MLRMSNFISEKKNETITMVLLVVENTESHGVRKCHFPSVENHEKIYGISKAESFFVLSVILASE